MMQEAGSGDDTKPRFEVTDRPVGYALKSFTGGERKSAKV